jgi:hypothetical protein
MPGEFITTFTDEHRQLRDVLLDLIDAFEKQDQARALEAIVEMEALAGPHFFYEQEELYPALAEEHGDEQVEKLLEEHAQAVEAASQLTELAAQEVLDEEAAQYGADLARQLLPHVSDNNELAVMVGVLAPQTIKKLHKAHKASKKQKGATLAGLAKRAKTKAPKKKVVPKATKATKIVRKVASKPTAKAPRASASKTGARKATRGGKRGRK